MSFPPFPAPMMGRPQNWTPGDLGSAIVAWWDASDLTTLTKDGSNLVSSWRSKVGTLSATQAGTAKPTWSATARNSRPGLNFAGAQELIMSALTGLPTGTIQATMAGIGYSISSTGFTILAGYGAKNTGQSRAINAADNGNIDFGAWGADLTATTVFNGNTRAIIVDVIPTGTISIFYEGLQAATKTGTLSMTTGSVYGAIGSAATSNFWNGTIQEIFFFSRLLTSTERDKLMGYMAWKWAIQSQLPAGHPYKNAPP